jgi:hypothetical protein
MRSLRPLHGRGHRGERRQGDDHLHSDAGCRTGLAVRELVPVAGEPPPTCRTGEDGVEDVEVG